MNHNEFILQAVKNRIRKIDPAARIILYGSRARNDAKKGSDWDFLILTSLTVNRELKNKINDELFEAELETDQILSGIVQSSDVWIQYASTPFFKNVKKDGIEI
jgi:predicted nucleotidyltransferase